MRKIAVAVLGLCMMLFAWQGDGQAGLSLCVEEAAPDAAPSLSVCAADSDTHTTEIESSTLTPSNSYSIRKFEPDSSCLIREMETKLPGENHVSEATISNPNTEAAVIPTIDKVSS